MSSEHAPDLTISATAKLRAVEPLLYSAPEVASALGISETKVRQMMTADIIPTVRLGNRVLVPVDALREWLFELREAQQAERRRDLVNDLNITHLKR